MQRLLATCFATLLYLSSFSQTLTFEDGTTVNVNSADFSFVNIRKASAGIVFGLDGYGGSKVFMASYLNPETFHLQANAGLDNISLEATYFFSGRTKAKKKTFSLAHSSGGYNTINVYSLRTEVEKRKEIGVYFSVNDYGNLLKSTEANKTDYYAFSKATILYLGISTVNYWQTNINVDDDIQRRGQFTGRAVLAPFYMVGGEVSDSTVYTKDEIPNYGARLFYELSNSFGIRGNRMRGRTNIVLRAGGDVGVLKSGDIELMPIIAFGIVYNFL